MAEDRPEQTPTGLGTFPESLVPTLGMPVSFLEGQKRFTLLTVWDHLETEPVRVIYTTGNTVDAIPLRDEFAGFANDRHDDGYHIPITRWVGVAPRHSISQFTVARQTIVNGVEIQLHTSPPGVVGENSVFVAIFSSTDANFTVARTLVGVLGYRHAHQIGDDYWTLIYLVANDITLNTGTYYWLALCASDPRLAPVDEWQGTNTRARRYLDVGAGVLLVDNIGDPYPDAGSTYDSYADRATWFRLYERTYTIEDIPLADGALAPGIGESATARRVAGVHHDMEIIGPSSGWSGLRTSSATASGGTVDHNWLGGLQGLGPDYYHLDVTQYGDLTTNMPFTPGSVIFVDAANDLAEDNANFQYNDPTNQLLLGVGSAAFPPYSFIGRTTDGIFSADAGAVGVAIAGGELARFTATGLIYAPVQFNILADTADGADSKSIAIGGGGAASGIRGGLVYLVGNEGAVNYRGTVYLQAGAPGTAGTYDGMILFLTAGAAAGYFNRTRQLCLGAGTAAAPALTRMGYEDDGMLWPGDGSLGWALAGVLKMSLDTNGTAWLLPHATALATNGQFAQSSTYNSLVGRMGDTPVRLGGTVKNVDSALPEFTSGTVEVPTLVHTMWSDTVDKDFWVTGKPMNVFAICRYQFPAYDAPPSYDCQVAILLGTEVLVERTIKHTGVDPGINGYYYVELHSRVTKYAGNNLRNVARVKQSAAVAEAAWVEGTPLQLVESALGRAAPVVEDVTTANVTLQVRVTFSRSAPGLRCILMDAGWGPETPVV